MFKKMSSQLDVPAFRKEQRKILPYTVRDIGNKEALDSWKADQARKEAAFQAGKEQKRLNAISILQQSMDAGTASIEHLKGRVEMSEAWDIMHGKRSYPAATAKPIPPEVSTWYQKLSHKVLNFFININFGN